MRFTHFSKSMKRLARMLLHMAVILFTSGPVFAAYNVTISSAPSVNGAWSGGSPDTWSPSETGANVSIYEILAKLNAGFDVNITTTGAGSDAGNINVNAKLSWNTSTLTLSAQKDININAVMSASNQASLAMSYGMDGNVVNPSELKVAFKPGEANGFAGRIDFPGRSGIGFLTINGVGYTVINSLGAQGSTTGFDLQGINGALAGNYALGANIDASTTSSWDGGAGFLPIGDSLSNSFSGHFDGLGHTVNGLVINRPTATYVGLFGYSIDATLRNIGLIGGSVSGDGYVGGLVGYSSETLGFGRGLISNSYNSSLVSGQTFVGGLAGSVDGSIRNSYNSGAVSGSFAGVGGLTGSASSGSISNSYSTGTMDGNAFMVGGLVGNNNAIIKNSYATGSVSGSFGFGWLGGLVGNNDLDGVIINSYAVGAVPLVAVDSGGSGGLVGGNSGTVTNITNSFWDTETSGQTISAGGSGVTSSAMKLPATFAGWDISSSDSSSSIWRITVGQTYPLLRTFIPSPTATSESATAVTTTGATLNGTVTANYAEALVSFEYGTTTAYGTTVSATPATVTSGSGNATVGIAIGSLTPGQTYHYRVKATNSAGTGYGDDVVFTALKMSQTISGFSPPATATYNDGPITLSASSTSALPVVFSVTGGPGSINGNQLTITGAGTIYLQASQSGNFTYSAAPNVTASINVAKAVVTVNLNNLNQIYNGSARAATATAPEGLSVSITYNGSSTTPTNAGSYNVIATIINSSNFQGTANGTLVIAKATATVTLGNLSQTYSGTAKPATATTNPAGKAVIFTYDGSTTAPSNAGSYTVVGTIDDANYQGSASGTLTIGKATATVTLGSLSQTYDGSAKSASATTNPVGLTTLITYDGSAAMPVAVGSYAVVATISDVNYQGSASGTLMINTPTLTVAVTASGTQPTGIGGTVTSSPAGISCANSAGGTVVTCTGNISGTVSLYATPYSLSTFGGWGGACSGLGSCSITMNGDRTVTAAFNQATLLHIDGTTYPTLQAAYDAAADGSFIQLLDNTVAGTLDANRNVTVKLKGGYDAGYLNNPGTTALTAPLTVRQGAVVVDRIVIK